MKSAVFVAIFVVITMALETEEATIFILKTPELSVFLQQEDKTGSDCKNGVIPTPEVPPAPTTMTTEQECPSSFQPNVPQKTFVKIGARCYYISHDSRNWTEALTECRQMNATLALPLDDKENQLLTQYFGDRHIISNFWLGGSDAEQEGTWVNLNNGNITYTNWRPRHPSGKKERNCLVLVMDSNGAWHDDGCQYPLPFICEKQYFDLMSLAILPPNEFSLA